MRDLTKECPAITEWLEEHDDVAWDDLIEMDGQIRREVERLLWAGRLRDCAAVTHQPYGIIRQWAAKLESMWNDQTAEDRSKARGKRIRQLEGIAEDFHQVYRGAGHDRDQISALSGEMKAIAEAVKVEGSGAPSKSLVTHEGTVEIQNRVVLFEIEKAIQNAPTHQSKLDLLGLKERLITKLLPSLPTSEGGTPADMVIEG